VQVTSNASSYARNDQLSSEHRCGGDSKNSGCDGGSPCVDRDPTKVGDVARQILRRGFGG
jgi:hypothetical protein